MITVSAVFTLIYNIFQFSGRKKNSDIIVNFNRYLNLWIRKTNNKKEKLLNFVV